MVFEWLFNWTVSSHKVECFEISIAGQICLVYRIGWNFTIVIFVLILCLLQQQTTLFKRKMFAVILHLWQKSIYFTLKCCNLDTFFSHFMAWQCWLFSTWKIRGCFFHCSGKPFSFSIFCTICTFVDICSQSWVSIEIYLINKSWSVHHLSSK